MIHSERPVALVLCAGNGKRMNSSLPKVMHALGGLPLVGHVRQALEMADISTCAYVIAPHMENVKSFVDPNPCYIQDAPKGTGHAVLAAAPFIESHKKGPLIILFGDTPLIRPETLKALLNTHKTSQAKVTLLGMHVDGDHSYGRLILEEGICKRIVEAKDASEKDLGSKLCNSGIMVLDLESALPLLREIGCENASREYYLTDCIEIASKKGLKISVHEGSLEEVFGINTKEDLAAAEKIFQKTLRSQALQNGVTLLDPDSVYLSYDTYLAPDTKVEPHVYFGCGVFVEKGSNIRSFSYLEGAKVGENSVIGPFARLRPGSDLEENVRIGNFVEIKQSHLSKNVKVNHLSYVGDADIGENVNIGAGTITCNYDGVLKHRTTIGENTLIGSNSSLVAPLSIGKNAYIGAGSVITQDVEEDALALTRVPQKNILEGSKRFKSRLSQLKKD